VINSVISVNECEFETFRANRSEMTHLPSQT
jgi:hypothetical protein